ncbi:hypothetical protein CBL_20073, partial [Carabus blaptoides fortunei]
MVFCAVVGCSSNNNKKSKNYNSECRYFSFPKDKEKLLDYPRNKWKLKPDAIPSIKLIKYPKPHTERSERVKKRRLMKDVHEHDNLNTKENEEISTAAEENTSETHLEINVISVSTQTERLQDDSEELRTLERECAHLRDIVEKQRRELQSVGKIFTKGQLRKLKSGKQVKWFIEDIASAVSLYAGGPRSYRLLRKRSYPLPGVSTLKRWAGKIDVQPGILNTVLKLMEKSQLPKMERALSDVPNIVATADIHLLNNENEKDNAEIVSAQMISSLDITEEEDGDDFSVDDFLELQWDALEYLAEYIAFKLRNKENLGYIPDSTDLSNSW